MVVANPSRNPSLGWKLGFWASELMHPYFEYTDIGLDVTICSPDGGKVEVDAISDPRDSSNWSADDIVSLGFLNTPALVALLEHTPRLWDLDWNDYAALVVCGGQSPMFTFRDNADLQDAIRTCYEAKVTAVFCHGVAALVDVRRSDGPYLVAGKTVTGYANVEEQFSDDFLGGSVMPWRLEGTLRERGANYVMGGRFKAFAVRDGNLITGQQQFSGRKGR